MSISYINQNNCTTVARVRILKKRDEIDVIKTRARNALKGNRLALINLYFDKGATCKEIAALTGKSEAQTYRKIKSIVNRLKYANSAKFNVHWQTLTENERKIAESCLFDGLSLKKTAALHGCTVYKVRLVLSKVKEK